MLLYQQINDYILNLIKSEPEISKLPSERQLLDVFNSTRITVREALTRLEAEGVVYRLNRKGWFVNRTRLKWNPIKKVDFYALSLEQGFTPNTKLLTVDLVRGDGEIRDAFNLHARSKLHQVNRLRSLDGRPVLYESIYCRGADFPDLNSQVLEGSITKIFAEHYGVEVTHERSVIFVSALPMAQAKQLEQNEGAPCLKIIRQRFNQQDELVDYNIEYWVHGAIEVEVTSLDSD